MLTRPSLGLVALLSLLILNSCGTSTETKRIKDYRFAVSGGDSGLTEEIRKLVQDFNSQAGVRGLSLVTDPAHANSVIIFTKGLQTRDGKVGWGQWLSETQHNNNLFERKKRIEYSMRLEFDEDYFRSRSGNNETAKMRTEKQKLFFHEVGHGLQLDHSANQEDVMYYDISGDKSFANYFNYVRSYLSDRSS